MSMPQVYDRLRSKVVAMADSKARELEWQVTLKKIDAQHRERKVIGHDANTNRKTWRGPLPMANHGAA